MNVESITAIGILGETDHGKGISEKYGNGIVHPEGGMTAEPPIDN